MQSKTAQYFIVLLRNWLSRCGGIFLFLPLLMGRFATGSKRRRSEVFSIRSTGYLQSLLSRRVASYAIALWGAALFIMASGAGMAQSAGEKPGEIAYTPNFVVLVYAPDDGPAQVSLSFLKQINHIELTNRIIAMAGKVGWQVSQLKLTDQPKPEGGRQTTGKFLCSGIVDRQAGVLGVAPLIDEFASEGSFRAIFMVPEMTNFSGPGDFNQGGIPVKLSADADVFEYIVDIPKAQQEEAIQERAAQLAPKESRAGKLVWWIVLGLACIGLGAVVIGWLRYGRK